MASHSHDGGHSHSHSHDTFNAAEHGHSHEILDGPGSYLGREMPLTEGRNWNDRAFTVGIGGPVGSGKTALMLALSRALRSTHSSQPSQTTSSPAKTPNSSLATRPSPPASAPSKQAAALLIESGGDNLACQLLANQPITLYPRKGGPGITQSDLLVVNKTDLAEAVGADLGVMERDARKMRRGADSFLRR
ncbi:hypothetical protein N0V88_000224 [Collariella sp. IMI 366227]|nr:hypothetical protein N0V88_000224 [Collariella sp. IMI 366227]